MVIYDFGLDENGRSTPGLIDIPYEKVSETEGITAKQPGTIWRIGTRNPSTMARTHKDYDSGGGAYEMHLGGPPHLIGWMEGHSENTFQNGTTLRWAPGDLSYVRPGALHHSNLFSVVPLVLFNLYLPGSGTDTGPFPWKK